MALFFLMLNSVSVVLFFFFFSFCSCEHYGPSYAGFVRTGGLFRFVFVIIVLIVGNVQAAMHVALGKL